MLHAATILTAAHSQQINPQICLPKGLTVLSFFLLFILWYLAETTVEQHIYLSKFIYVHINIYITGSQCQHKIETAKKCVCVLLRPMSLWNPYHRCSYGKV